MTTKAKTGRPPGAVTEIRREVERLWAEGKTAREIAEAVGWKMKNPNTAINVYRKRGWNLPHRHGRARAVCATCGAHAGQPCTRNGRALKHPHAGRRG